MSRPVYGLTASSVALLLAVTPAAALAAPAPEAPDEPELQVPSEDAAVTEPDAELEPGAELEPDAEPEPELGEGLGVEPEPPAADPDDPPAGPAPVDEGAELPVAIPIEEIEAQQREAVAAESAAAPLDTDSDEDFDTDRDEDFDTDSDESFDPLRDGPAAGVARRWFGAGIAATVTGAVLLGGGIAMSQTGPCNSDAGNNCFGDARTRASLTMGLPGGLLLAGGIAMTVVGALQKRQIKASFALAPGHYGLVVGGRF